MRGKNRAAQREEHAAMSRNISLIVYPVKDVARATALFRTFLGAEPYYESAYYVGFRVGDQEIGLDPNGHTKGQTGPIGYCDVDDIKAALQALLDAGAELQQDVTPVGGGLSIAWVKDADGNTLGLRQSS